MENHERRNGKWETYERNFIGQVMQLCGFKVQQGQLRADSSLDDALAGQTVGQDLQCGPNIPRLQSRRGNGPCLVNDFQLQKEKTAIESQKKTQQKKEMHRRMK